MITTTIRGVPGSYGLWERAFYGPPVEYSFLARLTDAEARTIAASRLLHDGLTEIGVRQPEDPEPSDFLTLEENAHGGWMIMLRLPTRESVRAVAWEHEIPEWTRILAGSRHGAQGLVNLVARTGIGVKDGIETLRRIAQHESSAARWSTAGAQIPS